MTLSTTSLSGEIETCTAYSYLPVGVAIAEGLSVDAEWRPAGVQSVLDILSQ